MAETEAAKKEKEERKREKNRKKRWAYRERQREKHQYHRMPNRRATARSNWSHKKGESKSRKKDRRSNENKKKTRKEKNEGRKKTKKKNVDQPKVQPIKNEEEWERMVFIALVGSEFDMLVKLFRYSLTMAATEQGEGNNDDATPPRRKVIKKYRSLSIKYHPDRHHKSQDQHGDATDQDQTQKMKHIGICYKTAFQALNEAYSNVISHVL